MLNSEVEKYRVHRPNVRICSCNEFLRFLVFVACVSAYGRRLATLFRWFVLGRREVLSDLNAEERQGGMPAEKTQRLGSSCCACSWSN
jgi:hypothetical protein